MLTFHKNCSYNNIYLVSFIINFRLSYKFSHCPYQLPILPSHIPTVFFVCAKPKHRIAVRVYRFRKFGVTFAETYFTALIIK